MDELTKPPAQLKRQETVILTMLASTDAHWYGLELVKNSGGELRRGTVYVYLNQLEGKGLVVSRPTAADHDDLEYGPRRMYTITELGKRALAGREPEGGGSHGG